MSEVDELTELGASQVIAEEFEATLELLGETLEHFGMSADSIVRFLAELRSEGYEFVRSPECIVDPWLTELLMEVGTQWVEVPEAIHGGTSLFDLDVRADRHVLLVQDADLLEVFTQSAVGVQATRCLRKDRRTVHVLEVVDDVSFGIETQDEGVSIGLRLKR